MCLRVFAVKVPLISFQHVRRGYKTILILPRINSGDSCFNGLSQRFLVLRVLRNFIHGLSDRVRKDKNMHLVFDTCSLTWFSSDTLRYAKDFTHSTFRLCNFISLLSMFAELASCREYNTVSFKAQPNGALRSFPSFKTSGIHYVQGYL